MSENGGQNGIEQTKETRALAIIKQVLDLVVTKGGVVENIEQVSMINDSFQTVAQIVISSLSADVGVKVPQETDSKGK